MCQRCNDVGYLSIRNGDDSIDCPECQGAVEGVTVAVVEPLSEVARIRLNLEAYEAVECTVSPYSPDAEWIRFTDAQDKVYNTVTDDLRILIDRIDSLEQSNCELLEKLAQS